MSGGFQNSGLARFGASAGNYTPPTYTPQQFQPRTFNSGTTVQAPMPGSPGAGSRVSNGGGGLLSNTTTGGMSGSGFQSSPYTIASTPISETGNYNSTGGGTQYGKAASGFLGGMLGQMFGVPAIAGNMAGQGLYGMANKPTDAGQTTHYSDPNYGGNTTTGGMSTATPSTPSYGPGSQQNNPSYGPATVNASDSSGQDHGQAAVTNNNGGGGSGSTGGGK